MGQCKLASKVGGSSGMKATLLWTNSTPTTLAATTFSAINVADYDYFMIESGFLPGNTQDKTTTSLIKSSDIITDGGSTVGASRNTYTTTYPYGTNRGYYNNSGKLACRVGYLDTRSGATYCVPLKIYGVKGEIKV